MSFSIESLQPQINEITRYAAACHAEVCMVTNKRIVLRCADQHEAANVARNLHQQGYAAVARPGLRSKRGYVQAQLNSPF